MADSEKNLTILGTRGIPAAHGGFETFAEHLSLYLVARGWQVTVYCQEEGSGAVSSSTWCGVHRVHIPAYFHGPLGTMLFDFKAILHSLGSGGVFLTLGYNTALFNIVHRIAGKAILLNMDGMEWQRKKWGPIARAWLRFNEYVACRISTHLIADNPGIEDYLGKRVSRSKITTIPYGAVKVNSPDEGPLAHYGLVKMQYLLLVARPEPENSILEIVRGFSASHRGVKLVVLGLFEPANNKYHREIMDCASEEVAFLGAIYNHAELVTLRYYCRFYLHGHQVGGTNPSLVEALGAGNPIIAHDNRFNRWVAGDAAIYFDSIEAVNEAISELLQDDARLESLRVAALSRFQESFQWKQVLEAYELLLERHQPRG